MVCVGNDGQIAAWGRNDSLDEAVGLQSAEGQSLIKASCLVAPVIAGLTRNLFYQGLSHAGRAGFAIQLTGKAEQRNPDEWSVATDVWSAS